MKIDLRKSVLVLVFVGVLLAGGSNLPFVVSAEIFNDDSQIAATVSVSISDKSAEPRTILFEWDAQDFSFVSLMDNSLEHYCSEGRLAVYLQGNAGEQISVFLKPSSGALNGGEVTVTSLSSLEKEKSKLPDISILSKTIEFTRVSNSGADLPEELAILCNPNPFNSAVRIDWELPLSDNTEIEVFDILGKSVNKIFSGEKEAGRFTVVWNGSYTSGNKAPSGIYFVRLRSGDKFCIHKIQLLR